MKCYGNKLLLYILEMRDICFNNIDCLLLSVPNSLRIRYGVNTDLVKFIFVFYVYIFVLNSIRIL